MMLRNLRWKRPILISNLCLTLIQCLFAWERKKQDCIRFLRFFHAQRIPFRAVEDGRRTAYSRRLVTDRYSHPNGDLSFARLLCENTSARSSSSFTCWDIFFKTYRFVCRTNSNLSLFVPGGAWQLFLQQNTQLISVRCRGASGAKEPRSWLAARHHTPFVTPSPSSRARTHSRTTDPKMGPC